MTTAPILKHRSLNYLLKEVLNSRYRPLVQFEPKHVNLIRLAPSAAIAYFLAKSSLKFINQNELNILIVGASAIDVYQLGYWYQLIPFLIGRDKDLKVKITIIGNEIGYEPACNPQYRLDTINIQKSSLRSFIDMNDISAFDLAVFFHPGYEAHWREWFLEDQPAGYLDLVRHGIPVIGTSFDMHEKDIDEKILEEFGYSMQSSLENPFYLDMAEGSPLTPVSINWGAVIWQLGDDIPSDNHQVDLSRIDDIHTKYEGVESEDLLGSILSMGKDFNHSKLPPSSRRVFESSKDFSEKSEEAGHMFHAMEELLEHVDPSFLDGMMNGVIQGKEVSDPLELNFFAFLEHGDIDNAVSLLIDNNHLANATNQNLQNGYHYAAILNSPKLVQALNSYQGNIDNQDNEGWTALMEAARKGSADALQSLVSAGANPDICSHMGWTPLAMSVSERQEESIKILLNAGADSTRMMPMGVSISDMSKMIGLDQATLDLIDSQAS